MFSLNSTCLALYAFCIIYICICIYIYIFVYLSCNVMKLLKVAGVANVSVNFFYCFPHNML